MSKRIKMVLYAEPGVGKSTFASHSEKPFFLCTDGNYSWLDLPEEDHIQVYTFAEASKVINEMVSNPAKYAKYETIVVDLIEDLYKFCEFEYCQKNKLEHIGDKGYGAGYDIVANQFFIEMCKLIGLDKHIIFLTHGYTKVEKDRRGVEIYKFYPSNRIRDKVWDMIEGRVRYFLRAYIKGEVENERLIKRRYLSLVPKENEFGIARGLDESRVPEDLNLDWQEFASIVGLENSTQSLHTEKVTPKKTTKVVKEEKVEEPVTVTPDVKTVEEPVVVELQPTEEVKVVEEVAEEKLPVNPEPIKEEVKELTQEEKLAKLKAKLAAMKK